MQGNMWVESKMSNSRQLKILLYHVGQDRTCRQVASASCSLDALRDVLRTGSGARAQTHSHSRSRQFGR